MGSHRIDGATHRIHAYHHIQQHDDERRLQHFVPFSNATSPRSLTLLAAASRRPAPPRRAARLAASNAASHPVASPCTQHGTGGRADTPFPLAIVYTVATENRSKRCAHSRVEV
eukprot:7376791-Prymnesium_polylepis.2